ncbi:helix-turn-helix domain-containing protein [Flavobacterium sp.]|uniref:helix-turn-helix domain-containing protein n=1 Tax=Flavobacterium sp. TaxID=239 RepID=UPI00286A2209|nr:helix-turn-helix domain-containing protein [Flavobacterium sp.]
MKERIGFIKIILFLLPIALLGQVQKNYSNELSYDDLWNLYFDNLNDSSKQIKYADAFLNKAKNEKVRGNIARGYYLFSLMHKKEKAIMYLDSVIKYSIDTDNPNFPVSAYCEKATILKTQFKFTEAMDNYLMAEKYATKNNDKDQLNKIKLFIAITKSEDLGEVDEAMAMYKDCFKYFKNKKIKDKKYSHTYQNLLFALADSYKALFNTDSATYYNRIGFHEAMSTKSIEMSYYFILNEGANQVVKKNYKIAIDSVNKVLPKIIRLNDQPNIMAGYYYLGKAYQGLKNDDLAVQNFIKVDSIYQKYRIIYPEFVSGYTFLISYYKKIGDKEKQLKYLSVFMDIDQEFNKNYKGMYKLLVKQYDIPHLISEKETLISSLKTDKSKYTWLIIILFIISSLLIIFALYQKRLNKTYKLRFEQIVKNTNQTLNIEDEIIVHNTNTNDISEVIIKDLLKKLKNFEDEKQYLLPNLKIETLSKEFDSNNKYLSTVVNKYKQKTFVQYVNDLRIDYAISDLQNNNKLRKYTIQALAVEFGFNNAESFSTSFYKKTGIKPTYFIKELETLDFTKN